MHPHLAIDKTSWKEAEIFFFFKKLFWESVLKLFSKNKMVFHQYWSFFSHIWQTITDAHKTLKGTEYCSLPSPNVWTLKRKLERVWNFKGYFTHAHHLSIKIQYFIYNHPLVETGERNGNPLQYFYLENPMDGGVW